MQNVWRIPFKLKSLSSLIYRNSVICVMIQHGILHKLKRQQGLCYKEYRDNCFVAYEGTELVGFIYGGVLCDTLYPQFMFVKEKNRKAGIGKRLMSALEESSHCGVSLIFYHKTLESHYQNEGYEVGTELRVAIKELLPPQG